MALDDIVFSNGDKQNFIDEIPLGSLFSPIDILHNANPLDFLVEVPDGTLGTPLDWMTSNDNSHGVFLFELTLASEMSYGMII